MFLMNYGAPTFQNTAVHWISSFGSACQCFWLGFLVFSAVLLQICMFFLNVLSTSPGSHLGIAKNFSPYVPLGGFLFTLAGI